MKFATESNFADPEKAARKLIEIANSIELAQDGHVFIELINWPFLSEHKGTFRLDPARVSFAKPRKSKTS